MVKLRKYSVYCISFFMGVTCFVLHSCTKKTYPISKIEAHRIAITPNSGINELIDDFVTPYRLHISKDLDVVLCYSPEIMDKNNGKWQTSIGNLMAQMAFEMGNPIFLQREGKNIDICILNHGGIRETLPKGNITARNAYEIMPFENNLVVIALKGTTIREMANYIYENKKAHPLKGLQITIAKNTQNIKQIFINQKPLDDNVIYYVATSDFLANGGDKMNFLQKGLKTYDLNYKIRNIILDYFKKTDTLPVIKTENIIFK